MKLWSWLPVVSVVMVLSVNLACSSAAEPVQPAGGTATSSTGFGCSGWLAKHLAAMPAVDTVDEVHVVKVLIQDTFDFCEAFHWDPVVTHVNPDAEGPSCAKRGSVVERFWGELELLPEDVRLWLMEGSSEGGVRLGIWSWAWRCDVGASHGWDGYVRGSRHRRIVVLGDQTGWNDAGRCLGGLMRSKWGGVILELGIQLCARWRCGVVGVGE